MSSGNGVKSRLPDDWMRDWVLVREGGGFLLGRIVGEDEDDIRRQMEETQSSPGVTLSPVYAIDARPHCFPTQDALGRNGIGVVHNVDGQRLEWSLGERVGAIEWNVTLLCFVFCSELPPHTRKMLRTRVEDVERAMRAKESGVVLPSGQAGG